jgi:uncharacterized protein
MNLYEFTESHYSKLKEGIKLYNEEKYWECHEELEDHWMEDSSDPVRYVYWAIIQVATSLYHFRDNNLNGTIGMLKKAQEKFQFIEEKKIENELLIKKLDWLIFKELVFKISNDKDSEKILQLYKFKFKL